MTNAEIDAAVASGKISRKTGDNMKLVLKDQQKVAPIVMAADDLGRDDGTVAPIVLPAAKEVKPIMEGAGQIPTFYGAAAGGVGQIPQAVGGAGGIYAPGDDPVTEALTGKISKEEAQAKIAAGTEKYGPPPKTKEQKDAEYLAASETETGKKWVSPEYLASPGGQAWLGSAQGQAYIASKQPKPKMGVGGGPGGGGGFGGGAASPKSPMDWLSPAEKETFALQAEMMKTQGATDEQIAEALASEAGYKKNLWANSIEEKEKYDATLEKIQADKQAFVDKALATQAAEADALAKTEIDPERFWGSKDTGEKIMMGIAVALSGFAGGPNQALGMLEKQIDADIQAQKANLEGKYKAYAAKQGIYAQRLAAFGDQELATISAKQGYLQTLDYQIQAKAAQTNSEIATINAQRSGEIIGEKLAALKVQMDTLAEQKANAQAKAQMAAAGSAANEVKAQNKKFFDANMAIATKKADEVDGGYAAPDAKGMPVAYGPDGQVIWHGTGGANGTASATIFGAPNAAGQVTVVGQGPAKTKEQAIKLDEAGKHYADAMSILSQIETHIDEKGTTMNPWGVAGAESDSLKAQLFVALKGFAAAAGGSPGSSENDAKLLKEMIPEPGALFSSAQKAKIDQLKTKLGNEYANAQKAYLQPGAQPQPLALTK